MPAGTAAGVIVEATDSRSFSLATYRRGGVEAVGLVVEETLFDLEHLAGSAAADDASRLRPQATSSVLALLSDWGASFEALGRLSGRVREAPECSPGIPLAEAELLAPVPRPGKMVNVGLNYRDHAEEMGIPLPGDGFIPNFFFKGDENCIVGPSEPIRLSSSHVDWEAELALVIGRACRDVDEAEAMDYVAGYTCHNDVSDRRLMFRADGSLDFLAGKARDTFGPLGPTLVPKEFVSDVGDLRVRCLVNGEVMQDMRTSSMVWGPARCVSYLSHVFTLRPGDVIALGTGAGVGWAKGLPPGPRTMADVVAHFNAGGGVFLHSGDRVVVEVEGVGRLENEVA